MRIYKIAAVTPEQNKKKIDDLDSDVKSLKKDVRSVESDVKKMSKDLNAIKDEIGSRRMWQQSTVFTSIQRKLERYEKLEMEWKKFKDEMEGDIRSQIEKSTRAQIRSLGPSM